MEWEDSCCNPLSLGSFKAFLISTLPGVYVKSLEIGDGIVEDTMNGFFMNANKQVEEACRLIRTDSRLQGGYNAIGFSQGGQFLRAVAQRCPNGMKKLISFGGQHQGIYGFPHCFYPNHAMCNYVRIMLDKAAYLSWVQNKFVQAQYWHDPINEDEYIQKSVFLADINNERNVNSTYKQGLTALEKLVLVKFADDTMVIPKESSWFGFYTPGQGTTITDLQQSSLYIEDPSWLARNGQRWENRLPDEPWRPPSFYSRMVHQQHLQISRTGFLVTLQNESGFTNYSGKNKDMWELIQAFIMFLKKTVILFIWDLSLVLCPHGALTLYCA
uniref:Palmitoyl-protein thioesterase 1 n=1 Tax=Lygus hesperus TaxID=30085 RepID=A0A0K8SM21_LYGHE